MKEEDLASKQFYKPTNMAKLNTKVKSEGQINLKSSHSIFNEERLVLTNFADTEVISRNGSKIKLNRAVLAAVSPLLQTAMRDFQSSEEFCIHTELDENQLEVFYQFATEGEVDLALGIDSGKTIHEGLNMLGIDLGLLDLKRVPRETNRLKVCFVECKDSEPQVQIKKEEIDDDHDHDQPMINEDGLYQAMPLWPTMLDEQEPLKVVIKTENKVKKGKKGQKKKHSAVKANKSTQQVKDDVRKFHQFLEEKYSEDQSHCCIACGKRFKTFLDLRRHLRRLKEHRNNTCPKCPDVEFKSWSEHQQHQKDVHKGVRSFKCKHCPEIFETHELRFNHARREHYPLKKVEPVPRTCIACGKQFKDDRGFKDHHRLTGGFHNNKCPKCPGVEFQSWPEHQQHLSDVHGGAQFFRCRYCPEFFETSNKRLDHFREKHSEKGLEKVQCADCGKLLDYWLLKNHQAVWHPNAEKAKVKEQKLKDKIPYNLLKVCCEQCGKEVKKKKMKEHMLNHHTPEDKKPFVCPVCVPVKGFSNKNAIQEHMNIHTGAKPHVCKLCPNVAYSNNANLLAHMRSTHQGIKRKSLKIKD